MKIQDYAFPRETPTEIKEMLDEIRRVINNGGYVPQSVTGIPAWTGDDGEVILYGIGNDVRMYVYASSAGVWNYGLPISSKYGWSYVAVTTLNSSATKAVAFGYTFASAPMVLSSFVGYSTSASPTSIQSFDTGLTKVVSSPYGITTTGFTNAIYSGDGSNFPAAVSMGFTWVAIG